MRTLDKIILCVIAVLAVSIGLLSARHSGSALPSDRVIVRYEPRDPPRFDRRIGRLSVQNVTFEQLISEISKAGNITIICQPKDVPTTVPRVTVNWTNVRLDTAIWIAFTVFERDPRLLFTDKNGRLVEGRERYSVPSGPLVLYDFRSIHMTDGDTDLSSVTEHTFDGAWERRVFAYTTSWKALAAIVGTQVTIYQGENDDLARPYLVSEKTIGCTVPMRSIIAALNHPGPADGNAEPQFPGARRIKDLRLTNVSVGEALWRACEASHVNTVVTDLAERGDPNAFFSVDLHDLSLPQAVSKIFDGVPDPYVSFSIREIDGVAVVCEDMASIAQYPVAYDVRKIVQKPQAWYDPSNASPVSNDDTVDKDDPYLLPGSALVSLLGEKLAEANQNPGGAGVMYWRGRIIVQGAIRAHRGIEKILAHILRTGRADDEGQ